MSTSIRKSPALSTASTVANNAHEDGKSSSTENKVAALSQHMLAAQQTLTELQAEQIASLQAKVKAAALSQKMAAAQQNLTELQAEQIASLQVKLKDEKKQKTFWVRAWDEDQKLIDMLLVTSEFKGQKLKALKSGLNGMRAKAKVAREEDRAGKGEVDRK